jgi:hypothetical protein
MNWKLLLLKDRLICIFGWGQPYGNNDNAYYLLISRHSA